MNIVSAERRFEFEPGENTHVRGIIDQLAKLFDSVESPEFAQECEVAASDLPRRLKQVLTRIRSGELRCGFLLLSGYPINDDAIGDSPKHWDEGWRGKPYLREELYQCLIASSMGGIFGWRTQENGRFLRHIVPIVADRAEQLGGSSSATLLWHTEEAFHPARADYFTLMCYRNNEGAETNISPLSGLTVEKNVLDILAQPRFLIEPDKSHLPDKNSSNHWKLDEGEFSNIYELLQNPEPCSVLYGPPHAPMMRVDQAFMRALPGDDEAGDALAVLHAELDRAAFRVIMQPGDLLLVDNLTVAHGRSIYRPHYGPKQRWMRRVNIMNGRRVHANFRDPRNSRVMI